MRKVLHLSDLHFGRVDTRIVEALARSVQELEPDLIAVSGDLTQRAKPSEFVAARDFLHSLSPPKVVVPGNHDIPLYDVFTRFRAPLERYRRYFGDEVEPTFVDDEIAVVGVNTARSLAFKGGRINLGQVRRARDIFCGHADGRIRVLVTHHPFDLRGARAGKLVGRASMALRQLRECLPDILLAGHMHAHECGTTASRYDLAGKSAIVVQAGTATSTRARDEQNSFNLLYIDTKVIEIVRFDWKPALQAFAQGSQGRYVLLQNRWTPQ